MHDPDYTRPADPTNRKKTVFRLLAVYLVATFLWRVLTTAHEYPRRSEFLLTVALDFLAVAGLIALKIRVFRELPPDEPEWTGGKILFGLALAAGLGLFAIRLTGDANWWTGHLFYELSPRPVGR